MECRDVRGLCPPPPPPPQVRQMNSPDRKEKTAVIVGTVTNDLRILKIPKLTVNTIHELSDCIPFLCSDFIYVKNTSEPRSLCLPDLLPKGD